MSFPWHNGSWRETAEFLGLHTRPRERILAPAYWWIVSRVERQVPANLLTEVAYDWVVVDADDVPQVPRGSLEHVYTSVVFARRRPRA